MDSVLYILFSILGAVLVYCIFNKKKNSDEYKLPPGPKGLPLLGNILQIPTDVPIVKILAKWTDKYGPIFKMQLGTKLVIVLNDAQVIREAFNNPLLNGRPNNKVFMAISDGPYGVINVAGDRWAEQRKFTMRHLRNFGLGKNEMENLIQNEAQELVDNFSGENGSAFDPTKRFSLAVLNSLWVIVTGTRFKQDDNTAINIVETFFDQLDKVFVKGNLSNFPTLADIFPNWSGFNKFKRVVKSTSDFFMKIVREHEESRVEGSPHDYIDSYLEEIKGAETDINSSFHGETGYKNLLAIIGDLFAAGAETTSISLSWAVLYLAFYPNVQKEFQEEIDKVIGAQTPSLSHRPLMPYTEALIQELFRKSSIASVGLFHRTLQNTTLCGYKIPKDSYVIPNFHRVHHDTKIWENPHELNPRRFLSVDENGSLKFNKTKSENVLPFSVGKRVCLGEGLARDTFFVFLTTIYQRFNIDLDGEASLEPLNTFIDRPRPYKVTMIER